MERSAFLAHSENSHSWEVATIAHLCTVMVARCGRHPPPLPTNKHLDFATSVKSCQASRAVPRCASHPCITSSPPAIPTLQGMQLVSVQTDARMHLKLMDRESQKHLQELKAHYCPTSYISPSLNNSSSYIQRARNLIYIGFVFRNMMQIAPATLLWSKSEPAIFVV